jgi:UPF0271 protein
MTSIDLNCDMGESFGAWRMGADDELMNYVSSINVACGFHAGDASVMRETVQMAIKKKVAIGAHPSFPDLQGFGRRSMKMSAIEIFDAVLYQVSALKGICEAFGARLHHVKPHGALYNEAVRDQIIAESIVKSVREIDRNLIIYGLSGSFLIGEAEKLGLKTASEVFADRTYQTNGSLTPRTEPNALIVDRQQSLSQILQMINQSSITSINGETIPIKAETICVHGDGEHALEFAENIRRVLNEAGITIRSI